MPPTEEEHKTVIIDQPVAYPGCQVCLAWEPLWGENDDDDDEKGADPVPTTTATTEVTVSKVEDPPVEIDEVEIELLARHLRKSTDIPYIPEFMEAEVYRVSITTVCKIAPAALPENLFMDLMKGKVDWSDVQHDVIQALNEKICIPTIPRHVQDELVRAICMVLFNPMADDKHRRKMISRTIQASLNEGSVEDFAKMLNEMIDVPFVSEEQEYVVALRLAQSIHAAFETLVPESTRELLRNSSSPEELQEARINLVNRMNEMIDIPFQSEQEEEVQFKRIVDFLLKRYGLDAGTKLPEEELAYIATELAVLEEELEVQAALHEKKIAKCKRKIDEMTKRRAELENEFVLPYFDEC